MTEQQVERRLTAILIADAVGYSRMMWSDEQRTLSAISQHRREFLDPAIGNFRGRLVKGTGDGFLAEFASVVDAVRCAIAMQQGMAARTAAEPPERRIVFRIGVNIGDIIHQDGDVFGDGVNVAARIEPLAEPGGICISKSAHDQVHNKIDARFADIGAHAVKNIENPVEAFALSPEAIAALPPMANAGMPAARHSRWIGGFAAVAIALIAMGWLAYTKFMGASVAPRQLDEILAKELTGTSPAARQRLVSDYFAANMHRSMVLAPQAKSRWWTADWPTAELAADKDLERCQVFFQEPCAVIAVDDGISQAPPAGVWKVQDMAKTHYAGSYDPQQIPGMRAAALAKPEVAGFAAAPAPKAAAYNVRGILTVISGAASQHQAEEQALSLCNGDTSRRESDGPCFLYAAGNRVVLTERHITPVTP